MAWSPKIWPEIFLMEEILHQLIGSLSCLSHYLHVVFIFIYIPSGCLGFLNHQQYHEIPWDSGNPRVAWKEDLQVPKHVPVASLCGFWACYAHAPSSEDWTKPKDIHFAGEEMLKICWNRIWRSNVGPPLSSMEFLGSWVKTLTPSLDYSAGNSEGAATPSLFGCVAFEDWRSPTTVICGDSSYPWKDARLGIGIYIL